MKIVILDAYAINPGDLAWDALDKFGEVAVYDRTAPDEVVERCKGAEIVLSNKVPLDADTIASLPDCKYIGVLATGFNLIDLDAATRNGIVVCNIPSYSTDSVAQNTFALLLALTNHAEDYDRRIHTEDRWTKCKDFCYLDYPLVELAGKSIGIVGYGHIGRMVGSIARTFGMRVMVYSSRPQQELPEVVKVDMDTLFKESDVISLHCPLTPETTKMINAEKISLMKPTAVILNTARGGLIEEDALAEALNSGRIAGAGLDVLSTEPPLPSNPLLRAKNCILTPHISWAAYEARKRLIEIAVANVEAFVAGSPINRVN
ncbi:MAG: D-2-hydroxyacid dehydrogenase [Muribaculaceae bacterium]|nr:D-2-hydroxyacid dehydrogenase [Muribaculaceae bacterium]